MNLKVISCVLILTCFALIIALILIRIPKYTSDRNYAGYFGKDALLKECGWLSNIIWAVHFNALNGWVIYSKSGYVAHNQHTIDYNSNDYINTNIHQEDRCPELSGTNHLDDIQPYWMDVRNNHNENGIPAFRLPCIFTFQPTYAGVIEGCMHAATAKWASMRAGVLTTAKYGAPSVILGPKKKVRWLLPSGMKGKDFKETNFQWESPNGEMIAFGVIPDFKTTEELMVELRDFIINALQLARINVGNTFIAEYPDSSATKRGYIRAMYDRTKIEPCNVRVDGTVTEPHAITLEDLRGMIQMEASDSANTALLSATSAGVTLDSIIESIITVYRATEQIFGKIDTETVSTINDAIRIFNRVINAGINPVNLIQVVNTRNEQYINEATRRGIDVDIFTNAVKILSGHLNAEEFIAATKPYIVYFNELQHLLDDVFNETATRSALISNETFRAQCRNIIAEAFLSPFKGYITNGEQTKRLLTVIDYSISSALELIVREETSI